MKIVDDCFANFFQGNAWFVQCLEKATRSGALQCFDFDRCCIAQCDRLPRLGSEFIDSRHDTALLIELRKRYFYFKKALRLNAVLAARSLRFLITLIPEVAGFGEPVDPSWIEAVWNGRNIGNSLEPWQPASPSDTTATLPFRAQILLTIMSPCSARKSC